MFVVFIEVRKKKILNKLRQLLYLNKKNVVLCLFIEALSLMLWQAQWQRQNCDRNWVARDLTPKLVADTSARHSIQRKALSGTLALTRRFSLLKRNKTFAACDKALLFIAFWLFVSSAVPLMRVRIRTTFVAFWWNANIFMIVDKTGSEQKTKTLLRRWKVLLMELNLFAFNERICHFKFASRWKVKWRSPDKTIWTKRVRTITCNKS